MYKVLMTANSDYQEGNEGEEGIIIIVPSSYSPEYHSCTCRVFYSVSLFVCHTAMSRRDFIYLHICQMCGQGEPVEP